jgi:hypothetical protein
MFKKYLMAVIFSGCAISAFSQSRDLDFYLKQALQNSPLLNDYRNQVKSAFADSLLIRAAKKTTRGSKITTALFSILS